MGFLGRWVPEARAVALLVAAVVAAGSALSLTQVPGPPATLRDTGLYADFEARAIDPAHTAFAPQYPLWTDGATKRRWISLPPGTAIDASDPEAFQFPAGTRFWKEFAFDGKPVETRYIEHLGGGEWLYAAYEWSADGREAALAPERGRRGAFPLAGGRSHTIPGILDCKVCHEANDPPILGFSALQLSPDRDPNALHAEPAARSVDLESLAARGLLVNLPDDIMVHPPQIAARDPVERAALGYLHGNCGHCHNPQAPLKSLGMTLRAAPGDAVSPVLETALGRPVSKPAPGQPPEAIQRIEAGHPERSAVMARMASRYAPLQMPPLGTELVDEEAVRLIEEWIARQNPTRTLAHIQGDDR